MVLAFQIVLVIIMFSAAVKALISDQSYDNKIIAYVVNVSAMVGFIASVMWL